MSCNTPGKLAAASAAVRARVLHGIRSGKEDLASGLQLPRGYRLSKDEVLGSVQPLVSKMFNVYVSAYRKAFRKEALSSRWESLTLIFVGGGSLLPGIKETFAS